MSKTPTKLFTTVKFAWHIYFIVNIFGIFNAVNYMKKNKNAAVYSVVGTELFLNATSSQELQETNTELTNGNLMNSVIFTLEGVHHSVSPQLNTLDSNGFTPYGDTNDVCTFTGTTSSAAYKLCMQSKNINNGINYVYTLSMLTAVGSAVVLALSFSIFSKAEDIHHIISKKSFFFISWGMWGLTLAQLILWIKDVYDNIDTPNDPTGYNNVYITHPPTPLGVNAALSTVVMVYLSVSFFCISCVNLGVFAAIKAHRTDFDINHFIRGLLGGVLQKNTQLVSSKLASTNVTQPTAVLPDTHFVKNPATMTKFARLQLIN